MATGFLDRMAGAFCSSPALRGCLQAPIRARERLGTIKPLIIRARNLLADVRSRRPRNELRATPREEHLFDEMLEPCANLGVKLRELVFCFLKLVIRDV